MVTEHIVIGIVVVLQLGVFLSVLWKILSLYKLFSNVEETLWVEPISVPEKILQDKDAFDGFLENLNQATLDELSDSNKVVDVIKYTGVRPEILTELITSINSYLLKNSDASPDFNILKDITQRRVKIHDEAISNQIGVPLYIGLAGTFLGIVMGLWSLNFQGVGGATTIASGDVQTLITGVRVAMIASFLGLFLTVINSAFLYKSMTFRLSQGKNQFYDFLQRDLLPRMGKGMADTMKSFQQHLDHFNLKFGGNLKSYERNFELINENLRKQEAFLNTVQKIGVVNLSNQIVATFEKLDKSARTFEAFIQYQETLNQNVINANAVVKDYRVVMERFDNFNIHLERIASNVDESLDFYQKFKGFLEKHYSELDTRKDSFISSIEAMDTEIKQKLSEMGKKSLEQSNLYDEQWRKLTDTLNQDIVEVFRKLSSLIEEESTSLKKYIAVEEKGLHTILQEHQESFQSLSQLKPLFDAIKEQLLITHQHYEGFHKDFGEIKTFLKENSVDMKLMNQSIQEMGKSIATLELAKSQKVTN